MNLTWSLIVSQKLTHKATAQQGGGLIWLLKSILQVEEFLLIVATCVFSVRLRANRRDIIQLFAASFFKAEKSSTTRSGNDVATSRTGSTERSCNQERTRSSGAGRGC